jgi:phosphate transport system substrate-binding protein
MVDGSPPVPEDDARFEREAAATGLVLPRRHPSDPWGAVAIAVAVIVVAAGIGEVTGWINLRSPTKGNDFETQTCAGIPIRLVGAVSSELDPSYAAWLVASGATLSQSVGGCVQTNVTNAAAGDVGSVLANPTYTFAATYVGPGDAGGYGPASNFTVVPVALTSVAIVYDLPGVEVPINLTGAVLAGIYDGTITSWSDPAIVALNPTADLAGAPPLQVWYHSGASAVNDVFSQFLSGSSASWNSSVGTTPAPAWPVGSGVSSDAAMLDAVDATPGAIGYIDLMGNPPTDVGIAQIENPGQQFVAPTAYSTWFAAESLSNGTDVTQADWSAFSLVGAPGAGAYPMAMLTYMGLYRDLGVPYANALSVQNATWVLEYVYWLASGAALAPLPAAFTTAAVNQLVNETYDGTKIVPPDNETGEVGGEIDAF